MAREKGCKKFGGRKKGTPNKKSQELSETLKKLKCNVPKILIETLQELEPEKKADILIKLMEYIYPKRKALEVTQEPEDTKEPKEEWDFGKLSLQELKTLKAIRAKAVSKDNSPKSNKLH